MEGKLFNASSRKRKDVRHKPVHKDTLCNVLMCKIKTKYCSESMHQLTFIF